MYFLKHILLISLFFSSNSSTSFAQTIVFKKYTMQDGLVANPIRKIYQDSIGFMWFATWEGLSKYDGSKFTNFNTSNGLSHNLVNDVYEQKLGKMLIAENNGTIDIIESDQITDRTAINSNFPIDRFEKGVDGKTIASAGAIYEISTGKIEKKKTIPHNINYTYIITINDSLLLAGDINNSTLHLLNKQYNIVAKTNMANSTLYCLYLDHNNQIWAGTNHGLWHVNMTTNPYYSIQFVTPKITKFLTSFSALKNLIAHAIIEDYNENLWIGTEKGLIKINAAGTQKLYTEKNGIPDNYISSLFEDKERNLWIGTQGGIAKLITQIPIKLYDDDDKLQDKIYPTIELTKEGFPFLYNASTALEFNQSKEKFIQYSTNNPSFPFNLKNVKHTSNFYDSSKGVYSFFSNKGRTNFKYFGQSIFCSEVDKNGTLVLGTYNGVYFYSNNKLFKSNTLHHRIDKLIIDHNGALWAGTWQNGLFKITYSILNDSINAQTVDMSHLILGKEIRGLFIDSENCIWVGTRYAGISKIMTTINGKYSSQHFDQKNGLLCNFARVFTEDKEHNIYVGSYLGIDKLIKNNNNYSIFNLSNYVGFFGDVSNLTIDKKNTLWVIANNHILSIGEINPEAIKPLNTYITNILLGKDRTKWLDENSQNKIYLSYKNNQVYFEFTAPGFINEKNILYSYRLLGSADTSWSMPTNIHAVPFASLQPGSYIFQVCTVNWEKKRGPITSVSFIVNTPFWQKTWFILLSFILTISIIYWLYRYRIKQLLKMQYVRNSIASDLHDEIGSSLTNINMLSELSKKYINEPIQSSIFINRISEEVTTSAQALDDIVWSINSQNDSMQQLEARMRRYAAEIFDGANINYSSVMDNKFANQKLDMEKRRDLFLIFKELINNIYKHADAKNVRLELNIHESYVKLYVQDDGKGFEINEQTNRNGINNIKRRISKNNGLIDIKSKLNGGSIIVIFIPL